MLIARMARPEVVNDAPAATQVISKGEIIDVLEEGDFGK